MSVKDAFDLVRQSEPRGRVSASGRIYDDLRQRILSLELPPGTNLLRTELAAKYQVSQTPLRDALQRLEQDGLVQIFPQSRTMVTRIDIPLIHEAYFLRTALETRGCAPFGPGRGAGNRGKRACNRCHADVCGRGSGAIAAVSRVG